MHKYNKQIIYKYIQFVKKYWKKKKILKFQNTRTFQKRKN